MTRQALGREAEFELGVTRRVVVGDEAICVVRCQAGIFAVADTCSHEDFSLAEGEVDADAAEIECWKHGSLFSLVTGKPLTLPATMAVATYRVEVEDGTVYLEAGEGG